MTGGATEDYEARPRVFGIGLNKTGTSSLHQALQSLGYNSLHWGGLDTLWTVFRAVDEGKPLLNYLDPDLDAFSDILPITYYFHLADVQYPGSRFVLTVRDLDNWLDSRRRHVEKNQQRKAAGEYRDDLVEVDIDGWRTEYVRHEAVVRAYFAARPADLLVFNVTGGDGWEPLCEFLGHPVPETPFPSVNVFRPWVSPPEQASSVTGSRGGE